MSTFAHTARLQLAELFDRSVTAVEWVGFWSAIVLPALHVPLLVAAGVTETTLPLLGALWVANALAVVVGGQYTPRGHLGGGRGR